MKIISETVVVIKALEEVKWKFQKEQKACSKAKETNVPNFQKYFQENPCKWKQLKPMKQVEIGE